MGEWVTRIITLQTKERESGYNYDDAEFLP